MEIEDIDNWVVPSHRLQYQMRTTTNDDGSGPLMWTDWTDVLMIAAYGEMVYVMEMSCDVVELSWANGRFRYVGKAR